MDFSPDVMFDYNLKEKRRFAYTTFAVLGLILIIAILYILVLQNTDIALITAIKKGILHIINNIKDKTLLGVFYASSIGGLFFVTISLEAVFLTFLKAGFPPAVLVGMYLFGLTISYTINYYLGMRLASLSQKAITPQKFYKIKGVLNKYGVMAIFFFNVLPLPSQPLSAILGVFKYNKAKFYAFFLLGQTIKYSVMVLAAHFIGA
ncbi:MAG: VTT domain-containing protein [Nanoarchaeota archaeon]|nr:VTT domain-containing protein [Nanoarchaeota archaeon]